MTKELLIRLAKEGYKALVRRHGEEYYFPMKGNIESIIDSLSIVPMNEDDFIEIQVAINTFELEREEFDSIKIKHLTVL